MADMKPETLAIRTQLGRSSQREHSAPLHLTSSFVFEDADQARAMFADEIPGNIYSRFSNPNNDEFVEKVSLLEGCDDGVATASGMAAVYASIAALLSAGDHVLACRSLFGSTHQLLTRILPRFGISYTYVDIDNPDSWEDRIQENTRMVVAETPSNPGLDLIDLEWLGELAHRHNLILNIDNCFATPYLQRPAEYGAHLVVHSATKYIDGQGRAIGGVVVGRRELIQEVRFFARHTGPALSPFNAWLFSKSLETLAVRMQGHCTAALELAAYLETHPEVASVKYPFLPSHKQYELARRQMKLGGGMVVFDIKGGLDQGSRFMDAMKMLSLTANLGDTRTIATHPATTTHSKMSEEERLAVGIRPGLIRISVGLEHIDDIKSDIDQALQASTKT